MRSYHLLSRVLTRNRSATLNPRNSAPSTKDKTIGVPLLHATETFYRAAAHISIHLPPSRCDRNIWSCIPAPIANQDVVLTTPHPHPPSPAPTHPPHLHLYLLLPPIYPSTLQSHQIPCRNANSNPTLAWDMSFDFTVSTTLTSGSYPLHASVDTGSTGVAIGATLMNLTLDDVRGI